MWVILGEDGDRRQAKKHAGRKTHSPGPCRRPVGWRNTRVTWEKTAAGSSYLKYCGTVVRGLPDCPSGLRTLFWVCTAVHRAVMEALERRLGAPGLPVLNIESHLPGQASDLDVGSLMEGAEYLRIPIVSDFTRKN